mgnify:CR=1 FL=1|jgi:hypothetical protein
MNSFAKIEEAFDLNYSDDIDEIKSIFNQYIEIFSHLHTQPDLLIDNDFRIINEFLNKIPSNIIKDFFSYEIVDNDTILHIFYDYPLFIDAISPFSKYIDFTITGKKGLTVLELAATTVPSFSFEIWLDIGAPHSSLRDHSLLLDIGFDGREMSDLASNSGVSIDTAVKMDIRQNIACLEEHGAKVSNSIKEEVNSLSFNIF